MDLLKALPVITPRMAELLGDARFDPALTADLVSSLLPDWEVVRPCGGLCLWAKLPEPVSTSFSSFAGRFGVSIAGGREFSTGTTTVNDHIRVPFCAPEDQLPEGVARVARAWTAFQELTVTDRQLPEQDVLAG